MTAKFTEAQVENIVGTYTASVEAGDDYDARMDVVKQLADELEVSVPAIRGKLVAEKVYVKKEVAAKAAKAGVSKEDISKAFEASFGIKMPSMRNMTKKDLQAFWGRFVEMSEMRNTEHGE